MIFRFFLFCFLISLSHSKTLHILDIPIDNISVNINGTQLVRENSINIDKFTTPLNVSVYYVSKNKKQIYLSLQKTFPLTEENNYISNSETIVSHIENSIRSNLISSYNSNDLRSIVNQNFKNEIDKFISLNHFNLFKKFKVINSSEFNKKISDIALEINNDYYSDSVLELHDFDNLSNYYIITKSLELEGSNVKLNTISTYDKLRKKTTMKTSYNKNTIFLVFDKNTSNLAFLNYLEPYRNIITPSNENNDLVSIAFDELLLQCTELFTGQRDCYYFDLVEDYVGTKEILFERVLQTLPENFNSYKTFKKLSLIRKLFREEMVNIVNNSDNSNVDNSSFF